MSKLALKYLLLLAVLLFLQFSVVPLLMVYGVYPDLPLLGVILIAIRHGTIPAILFGFLIGFGQDAVFVQLFGLHSLAKSIAAFVAGSIARSKSNFSLQVTGYLALMTALAHNLAYDSVYHLSLGLDFFQVLIRYVLPNSLYLVVIVMIVQIVSPKTFARREIE